MRLEGKRALGSFKCSWEDTIKMDLQEVGWGGRGAWTGLLWLMIQTGGGYL